LIRLTSRNGYSSFLEFPIASVMAGLFNRGSIGNEFDLLSIRQFAPNVKSCIGDSNRRHNLFENSLTTQVASAAI
jgi:hypothetical protein